jgi:aspartate/methionine/tyrosine aminotransferase
MWSSRFRRWDLSPNRLAARLRDRRRDGPPVLDLTVSNPTVVGLEYPWEEIASALSDDRGAVYTPVPAGSPGAREAVAAYHRARGATVGADRVVLTSSTSEAYAWLFKLLTDPGDEILVPRPSYPLFEFLAGMENVATTTYPLVYRDGWEIDLEALSDAVTDRTRAVLVVSPNNPTGSVLRAHEYESLVRLASDHGIALIADEVFADYTIREDPSRCGSLAGRDDALTFCLSGLSKVVALPQMKLGWIVAGGPEDRRLDALDRLELIADTYLSVGTAVQVAAPRLLARRETMQARIRSRTRKNLDLLTARVESGGACSLLDVEGGWTAVLRVPATRTGEDWAILLLEEDGVLVQPGYLYDFDGEAYLVVSLLPQPEIFEDGVERLLGRVAVG